MAEFWIEVVDIENQFFANIYELIARVRWGLLLGPMTSGFLHRGIIITREEVRVVGGQEFGGRLMTHLGEQKYAVISGQWSCD